MTRKSENPTLQHYKSPAIHFIGIGGCGMNGVAQLAAHSGYSVSGSDRATGLDIFQCLKKQGIVIVPQDGSGITEETDFVVFSTAIESDNPDILKAKTLNIPLLHRAKMLAKLCEGKEVIAVAGTAGKSTVTGLLGYIFQCLEKDPTVYCGAAINNFGSSVRFGSKDGPWIIEADESDKSFLNFHPNHAIITNIAEDHFELSELKKLFTQFESQVSETVIKPDPPRRSGTPPSRGFISSPYSPPPEGWPKAGVGSLLIGEHNTENINNALTLCKALDLNMNKCIETVIKPDPPRRSGTPPRRGFISSPYSPPPEGWPKAGVGSLLIGEHNTENINNALTLCKALDLNMNKCIEAVASFKGIERRLERIGDKVIDDFAHSPIKIAAALDAVSGVFETFNAVWRPHGFTPLFQGLEGFIEVFSTHWRKAEPPPTKFPNHWKPKGGRLFILPVYYAGGTVDKKVTAEQFVEKLRAAGVPAEFVEGFQCLEKRLLDDGLPVLVMGARDPELPIFSRRIANQLCTPSPH